MPAKSKAKASPKAARKEAAKGFTRLYPTHRRSAGSLLVTLPSDGVNSPDPIEITDEGADVPDELAEHLINIGEATKKSPEAK